ncbi:MAG: trypsin-like peptidase domain-containing protein [Catenulispora sp.]
MAGAELPASGGAELIAHAEKSAVAVLAPGERRGPMADSILLGSGFFIAPDLVLTCAHVVGGEPELYLRHGTETLPVVEVEMIDPEHDGPGSWPVPDLALLRVPPARTGSGAERCPVWLDLAPDLPFLSSAGYLSVGYDDRGPGGRPQLASRPYSVGGVHNATGVPGLPDFKYYELTGDSVPKYRSGSMVIDLATARVTGIIKAARAGNDGVGGYAVPLAGLLPRVLTRRLRHQRAADILGAHDTFHARIQDWPALCANHFTNPRPGAARREGPKEPLREAALLGLLASIRNVLGPAELYEIMQLYIGLALPSDTDLRELALALAGTTTWSATDVHSLLRFMDDLTTRLERRVGAGWLVDARRWADGLAAALGQTSRLRALRSQTQARRRASETTPAGASSLQVVVDPSFDLAGGYHISIRLHYGAAAGVEQFPEGTVQGENVLTRLRAVLPDAVRVAADLDRACLVDLVLPMDMLGEPVHSWEAVGNTPIGRLLPVAVRAVERYRERDDGPGALLRAVWTQASQEPVTLHWVMCADPDVSDQLPDHTGLGLVNPPTHRHRRSRRLLGEAVERGLPLLVWSASDCGVDHTDPRNAAVPCTGPYFQGVAEETLRGVLLEEVPRHLFARRTEAGLRDLDTVAVFWDNPELSHEDYSLTEPCYPEDA